MYICIYTCTDLKLYLATSTDQNFQNWVVLMRVMTASLKLIRDASHSLTTTTTTALVIVTFIYFLECFWSCCVANESIYPKPWYFLFLLCAPHPLPTSLCWTGSWCHDLFSKESFLKNVIRPTLGENRSFYHLSQGISPPHHIMAPFVSQKAVFWKCIC